MNYKKIYDALIERAQGRIPVSYTERHHIVPRCIGGTDDTFNIVCLAPEEHYLAHQLLIRIYPQEPKLVYAALLMTQSSNGTRMNNKLFGWIRKRLSESRKGPHSEGRKKRNSEAQLKRAPTKDSTRAKMSASRTGLHRTEEQKRKSSETQSGRKRTPEQIEKTRQASLKSWAERKEKDPTVGCGINNPNFGKIPHNKIDR